MQMQLELKARIERYGRLRSAVRAVDASCSDAGGFGLDASFQTVRGWLLELRAAAKEASAGPTQISSAHFVLLEDVDRMLDQLQREIVELVRSIPLSQLRATLPAINRQRPETLKALLDLCLISHASGSAWPKVVDYLITLLVCEEANGRRHVARDPTSVTALTKELCEASDRDKSPVTSELATLFDAACAQIERGAPAPPIIEKMRSAKHQAMETLLVPEVLRAITAYNVAVSNHRADLIETELALEDVEFKAFEESLGAPATASNEAPPTALEPELGGARDSAGLRAIVAALRCRLRREPAEPGPAAELVAGFDVAKLSAYEAATLRGYETSPVADLVSITVCMGLILRNLAGLRDPLQRLGIRAEQLETEWLPEIENRLAAETAGLMSGDGYEEARRLAEVRTRQLQHRDAGLNVWRLEREPTRGSGVAIEAPPAESIPQPEPKQQRKPRSVFAPAHWRAITGSIACMLVLAAGAYVHFVDEANAQVAFFSDDQLEAISFYIESGYRNGQGSGSAFVGTLRPQWANLSAEERAELGSAIARKLRDRGISEFMFFDERRELRLQHAGGRLVVR